MRGRRLWSILLVPCGLVAGHVVGYRLAHLIGSSPAAGDGQGIGHAYLASLWLVAVPLTIAVVARAVLGGFRAELPPVRLVLLAGVQIGAYVAIEIAEHAAAGIGPAVSVREPSMALGVVAQVVVAWLLWRLVRSANEVAARLSRRAGRPGTATPRIWRPVPVLVRESSGLVGSISARGPPLFSAA